LQETLANCHQRSLTNLGSSNFWPPTYSSEGLGILQTDHSINRFANWTKIAIIYCDGTLFQGNNIHPVPVNGTNLYFRGSVNMRSHFSWANAKFDFNKAKKILLTGSSAGGIGTFLWIDYLKSLVIEPSKVYGVVDSGIFMDPATLGEFNKAIVSLIPFETTPSQPVNINTNTNNPSFPVLTVSAVQ
jgi:hypothetical protein